MLSFDVLCYTHYIEDDALMMIRLLFGEILYILEQIDAIMFPIMFCFECVRVSSNSVAILEPTTLFLCFVSYRLNVIWNQM